LSKKGVSGEVDADLGFEVAEFLGPFEGRGEVDRGEDLVGGDFFEELNQGGVCLRRSGVLVGGCDLTD